MNRLLDFYKDKLQIDADITYSKFQKSRNKGVQCISKMPRSEHVINTISIL